jgi:hypothetical protein
MGGGCGLTPPLVSSDFEDEHSSSRVRNGLQPRTIMVLRRRLQPIYGRTAALRVWRAPDDAGARRKADGLPPSHPC